MNIYMITEYINKLKKEDINNYAQKQGIKLDKEELDIVYNYIKATYTQSEFNNMDYVNKLYSEIVLNMNSKFLENEIGCQNIDFNTITDYIILISFLLKSYGIPKIKINRFINDFEKSTEEFRNKISINIYNQVIYTDNKLKLTALRNYIKK